MKLECPGCGTPLELDTQNFGRNCKCPECGKTFEAVNPNLTPCPDCFMPISRRANTCPHCGAVLMASVHPEAVRREERSSSRDLTSEREIMTCHPSAMNYLWLIILGIVTLPILIGIYILVKIWIEIRFTTYRITSLRIVVRTGLISKYQNEIWIKDMRGASLIQGIWQRIIDVGDVSIGTAATSDTEILMTGIASPQKVVDTINALR